jgi:hypothetical protein
MKLRTQKIKGPNVSSVKAKPRSNSNSTWINAVNWDWWTKTTTTNRRPKLIQELREEGQQVDDQEARVGTCRVVVGIMLRQSTSKPHESCRKHDITNLQVWKNLVTNFDTSRPDVTADVLDAPPRLCCNVDKLVAVLDGITTQIDRWTQMEIQTANNISAHDMWERCEEEWRNPTKQESVSIQSKRPHNIQRRTEQTKCCNSVIECKQMTIKTTRKQNKDNFARQQTWASWCSMLESSV